VENSKETSGLSLHWQILLGLLIGIITGLFANAFLNVGIREWIALFADIIGQIFLRLIFMVVVPLVFCALVLGVASIGDTRKLGRMGMQTLCVTLIFSITAVVIGIALANTLKPGNQISEQSKEQIKLKYASAAEKTQSQANQAKSPKDAFLDIIPRNPLQEAVGSLDGSSPGSGMLGVMFFSLCFGIALTVTSNTSGPVIQFLEGVYEAVMVIIRFAMRIAPFGVCGLAFTMTSTLGFDIVKALLMYVIAVLAGLALQMFVVYSIALTTLARRSPTKFFSAITEVLLTAFATSSSNATLPTSLRVVDENLKLDSGVSRFVLTIGSTANQNGTALYEGLTVLFIAQVFGVELTLTQQIVVVAMATLAGIGTAGVPGGSLPLVVLVLQTIKVPPEGIGIIMGVDRLLDMSRTTVNVAGDIAVATIVDRWTKRGENKSAGEVLEPERAPVD
jgi:DAACS family dicarboxylate/amino acid:cation (Na+ or H+) symporter